MQNPVMLLSNPRFWPLFWAQFLSSFNDNVLKNALVLLVVYQGVRVWGVEPAAMATVAPALLVLPYFMFSSIAGQLADKYPKSWLIQRVKLCELGLMAFAALGFLLNSPQILIITLFLIGTQATFLGPLKYSVLPEYLHESELVAGNALQEGGTNLSILFGTIAGGILIAMREPFAGTFLVAGVLVVLSVVGWWVTWRLPSVHAQAPDLPVNWNPITTTWRICADVMKQKGIWNAILGISWLWTFGFAFLSLMLPWVKDTLHGTEAIVTLFLAIFSIGVGIGSLICERVSFGRLELGLVPLGSLGVSLFTLDLAFASGYAATLAPTDGSLQGVTMLLSHPANWRLVGDLLLIAVFAGFFLVPLYTCLQIWAVPQERSRVIGANNIVNALMIVVYAPIQVYLLSQFTVAQIFALLAVVNAVIAVYIYRLIPEFTLRFVSYLLTRVGYRLHVRGLENVPETGGALLVCNHITWIDWLFIGGALPRPVHFVMWAGFAKHPLMKALVRDAKIIPIYPSKEDPETLQRALDQIATDLGNGELVCVFPEGRFTPDGELCEFKPGMERMVARTPVPVIPMALKGLWGSYFSLIDGKGMRRPFRRGLWSSVELVIAEPVPPEQVKADHLRHIVLNLIDNREPSAKAEISA